LLQRQEEELPKAGRQEEKEEEVGAEVFTVSSCWSLRTSLLAQYPS